MVNSLFESLAWYYGGRALQISKETQTNMVGPGIEYSIGQGWTWYRLLHVRVNRVLTWHWVTCEHCQGSNWHRVLYGSVWLGFDLAFTCGQGWTCHRVLHVARVGLVIGYYMAQCGLGLGWYRVLHVTRLGVQNVGWTVFDMTCVCVCMLFDLTWV